MDTHTTTLGLYSKFSFNLLITVDAVEGSQVVVWGGGREGAEGVRSVTYFLIYALTDFHATSRYDPSNKSRVVRRSQVRAWRMGRPREII